MKPRTAWLLTGWIVSCLAFAAPAAAAGLVFRDPQFSFQTLRALSYAVSGAADVGEVLGTAGRITEGDEESWFREWFRTAGQREEAAEGFLARGSTVAARREFLKAANYFRTAEFFLRADRADPRIVEVSRRGRACFRRGAALASHPVLPVEIPFEGTTLPGYLCLVDRSGAKRPLLIVHSGFDGTAEELYAAVGVFAVERGYNVLLFEGPGQGRVIREQGLPFRPDWETVVTPVVDFALRRREVDPRRIALMGISFGGYFAPRAAAFEKRIKACIANGGVYDFHLTAHMKPEDEAFLDTPEGAAEIDRILGERMKASPSLRWSINNGLFTFRAAAPSEWIRMTRAYNLRDVASRITCPTLVVDSAEDKDMPGQAPLLHAALTCPKTFLLFTREEGAEEHCQMGALLVSNAKILDWLDTVLKPAGPAGKAPKKGAPPKP